MDDLLIWGSGFLVLRTRYFKITQPASSTLVSYTNMRFGILTDKRCAVHTFCMNLTYCTNCIILRNKNFDFRQRERYQSGERCAINKTSILLFIAIKAKNYTFKDCLNAGSNRACGPQNAP